MQIKESLQVEEHLRFYKGQLKEIQDRDSVNYRGDEFIKMYTLTKIIYLLETYNSFLKNEGP